MAAVALGFGQLAYGAYNDAQARSQANQANRLGQTAQERAFPAELQMLRQNYGDSANQLAPYLLNGGFGNYGNYNPYQQGYSPFAQYSQPYQQYDPYQGGRSFPSQGDQRQISSPYTDKLDRGSNPDPNTVPQNQSGSALSIQERNASKGLDVFGYPLAPNQSDGGSQQGFFDNQIQQDSLNPGRFDPNGISHGSVGGSGDGALPSNRFTQGYVYGQDYGNPNSPLSNNYQQGGGGQAVNGVNQLPYQLPNGQQSQLELLNQASQLNYNPQIDQLVGQQGQNIQNAQGLNFANLQQFQGQLGGINNQSQNNLAQLIAQSQGQNQNIQNLFNQQSGQQGQNNPQLQALMGLLNQGQQFSQGGQDVSGFNQFTGAVGGSLQNNQSQINGVDQQTQALIDANNKASQFQQDKSIQDLNDQLSARGLSNSQAGLEAISGANAQFARQRAGDEAKFRQDALNQAFQQRQSGNALQGQLAGQGANILSQQGQLGNADLNARIRALDTSGNLAQGAGGQNTRGIQDLIQLLGAGQSGIGNINQLQNQANQQNAGFAQTNYGLNQQGINNNQDSLNQLLALYQGNENRNLQLGQQAFSNRGAVYDRGMGFLTNAFNAGQQGAIQGSQIGANQAQYNFAQAQATRAGSGELIGQGFETLVDSYNNRTPTVVSAPPQQNYSNPPTAPNYVGSGDVRPTSDYDPSNGFYR